MKLLRRWCGKYNGKWDVDGEQKVAGQKRGVIGIWMLWGGILSRHGGADSFPDMFLTEPGSIADFAGRVSHSAALESAEVVLVVTS